MRQREIEKIGRVRLRFCRHDTLEKIYLHEVTFAELEEAPVDCEDYLEGECTWDGCKCDAVKFQLKEVKDDR